MVASQVSNVDESVIELLEAVVSAVLDHFDIEC